MRSFSLRLKGLRCEKGLSQKACAAELNVGSAKYNRWENGTNSPDYETVVMLADYFDVSVDFLFGRTQNRNFAEDVETKGYRYVMPLLVTREAYHTMKANDGHVITVGLDGVDLVTTGDYVQLFFAWDDTIASSVDSKVYRVRDIREISRYMTAVHLESTDNEVEVEEENNR